jgi:hypothetical protein
MKTTLKDWPKMYRKLGKMRWMSQDEKIQFARFVAATPDERWEMNWNCVKTLGFVKPVRSLRTLEARKRKLRDLQSPKLWKLQLSNREFEFGRIFGLTALYKLKN